MKNYHSTTFQSRKAQFKMSTSTSVRRSARLTTSRKAPFKMSRGASTSVRPSKKNVEQEMFQIVERPATSKRKMTSKEETPAKRARNDFANAVKKETEECLSCPMCKERLKLQTARFHMSTHYYSLGSELDILKPQDNDFKSNKYSCQYQGCIKRKMPYKEMWFHLTTMHGFLNDLMKLDVDTEVLRLRLFPQDSLEKVTTSVRRPPRATKTLNCPMCEEKLRLQTAKFHLSTHYYAPELRSDIVKPLDNDFKTKKYQCKYTGCVKRKMPYKEFWFHLTTQHEHLNDLMKRDVDTEVQNIRQSLFPQDGEVSSFTRSILENYSCKWKIYLIKLK